MSAIGEAALLAVFVAASSVWVGGYVAIAVVSRVAARTLEPRPRVAFFRALGRSYGRIGVPALVIALATAGGLLRHHAWDGPLTAAVAVAAALVLALAVGMEQARRMSRLRARALAATGDPRLAEAVRRGARAAAVLRAAIGLLSLALIALGAVLAT